MLTFWMQPVRDLMGTSGDSSVTKRTSSVSLQVGWRLPCIEVNQSHDDNLPDRLLPLITFPSSLRGS